MHSACYQRTLTNEKWIARKAITDGEENAMQLHSLCTGFHEKGQFKAQPTKGFFKLSYAFLFALFQDVFA